MRTSFCVEEHVKMNLCDKDILNLISAAKGEGCDCCFAPDISPSASEICRCAESVFHRTVVILPGNGILPTAFEALKEHPSVEFKSASVLYDLPFWEDAAGRGTDSVILLNAEVAERSEYGYVGDYKRLSDIRAGLPAKMTLIALFSGSEYVFDKKFLSYFGSTDAVALGKTAVNFSSELFANARERENALIDFLSKRGTRTAVFFDNRREAENFSKRLDKKCIAHGLFHGGLSDGDKISALTAAVSGETKITVATKSLLQYTPFLPFFETVCCGVPYSVSHASRITAVSHSAERHLKCFYCIDDVYRIINIGKTYAAEYTDDPEKIISERTASLTQVLKKIM